MDFAKVKSAEIQSSVELLMQRWMKLNIRLKDCVEIKDEPFASKMRELREREYAILMEARELDSMERESQKVFEEKVKMMDQRSLDLDSQERALAKREIKLQSKLEWITRRRTDLQLGEKNLANLQEAFEIKKMDAFADGSAMNESQVAAQDRLHFPLTIVQSHGRSYMTVPTSFTGVYDLSVKKYVILSTDKGDFRLNVRYYTSGWVFRDGWRGFYDENRLTIGLRCIFTLKENTVNGDPSGFSMEVSVFGR